jgi:guanylate kinase
MNRAQYDTLRKRVISLEHKLKDAIDDHSHTDARKFKDAMRAVEDALQVYKHPRSIEDLVKRLEQSFNSYSNPGVMNQNELNFFADHMQNIRQDLRQFENY